MKYRKILLKTILLITSALVISCGDHKKTNTSNQSNTNKNANQANEKIEEKVEVEISGVYSGTDNVGMESTIILESNGSLTIHPSVGDGTPSYGSWNGNANNVTLYIKNEMGGDQVLGNAKITEEGLSIMGGKFYSRK